MFNKLPEIDQEIKKRLEEIHTINRKWMTKKQYEWFINYKFNRENIGDVVSDSQFVMEHIPQLSFKKILDVGCGTGDLTVNLARENINAFGIDMGKDEIEVAKLKAKKYNLKSGMFQVQDGSKLPFPDNSFDVVLCIEVLEHTGKYYMDVLSEIFRILKPKGFLYMTIPNKLCPYDTHLYTWIPHWLPKYLRIPYLNLIRGEKAKTDNYLLDYNFFSSREITNILKQFTSKMDVNKKYLNHWMKNLNTNSNRDFRSLMKYIVKKSNEIKSVNYLTIKMLTTIYMFQSIKILAEKE